MARIKQSSIFNLPQDGKLGFQSEVHFNWRDDPNVVHCRRFIINAIQMHLAQNASSDFMMAIPQLASSLENQIFLDAISQEDYVDQVKLLDRVRILIMQKWREVKSDQQKVIHDTNLPTIYTTTPTVRMMKSDFGNSFNRCIPDFPVSADTGSNLACPDNLSRPYPTTGVSPVAKVCFHESRKRSFSATLPLSEHTLPNSCSPREGFSCGYPVDSSGPTFSGSVLQYDSEASFESHCNNSRYFNEGDLNLIMSSNQSSPSVQTPSIFGEIPMVEASTIFNNGVNGKMQRPLLEPRQFEEQLFQPKLQYDNRCSGKLNPLDRMSGQNKNFYAFQDARTYPLPLSDMQRRSIDKLLSCYILYKKNCFEHKLPFLEFWHSQNCNVEACSCENSRMALSHFNNCGSFDCGICAPAVRTHDTSGDLSIPAKCRRLNPSSPCDVSGLSVDPSGLSGPFNVDSGSPMVTSDNPVASIEMVGAHVDDHAMVGQAGYHTLGAVPGSSSDDVTGPAESVSVDLLEKDMKPASPRELKDMGADPESVASLCEDKNVTQGEDAITRNDSEIIEPKEVGCIASLTEMKSEKQKVDGISLIDFFTEEEIKQHIYSLRQKADQALVEEVAGSAVISSVNENVCQLCTSERLSFPPMPIYCSACGVRVKNYQSYYSTKDDRAQFCFCTRCYHRCRGGNITFYGFSISKNILELRKNNLVTDESWVQCDKCEGWQHQICALFNDKRDLGGKVEYICPKCHLEDLETGKGVTLPRTTSLDASNLPRTLLSDHLERRLFRRLNEEREERAKAEGNKPEEVAQPADLVVRVVSSVDKMLKVKQQFLDIFPEKNYPAEFPYRSKVILVFQRIEGVDVCLFAMYVQEFGSDCSLPNQRCVYISYLDSVKYFRPDIRTLKGEALRTFVYHEILVGYLDYCKRRGFATCYIWACPPVKGEDYILYCHPETQKTPRPDKLRQWYQTMLKKATEEKIVVNFSNLYEKFFVPNGECNTKVTAARLPYFEGDYWSGVAENMIKKIELESGGDPEKQIKKMTRRSLKAMGHTNPSAREAKDILLMQALAQSISSAKEDFIIVYLQYGCSHCHEVILSGKRRFCHQCKNYQLCERCHDKEQYSGEGESHISSCGQKHALFQETVNDVPVDTEDNDAIMNNCFLENRHTFLNFCQGNHYQFDTFRRAKHSSMMILYHLHNQNESSIGTTCSLCLKCIGANNPKWTCEMCPDFIVCSMCHQRSNACCHVHTLMCRPPVISGVGSRVAGMVRELLDVLLHASRCQTNCSYSKCTLLRRLFSHAHACSLRVSGGCHHCRKTWFILMLHCRRCKDSNCYVPRCLDLKEHVLKLKTKSESGHKKALPDASRQPVPVIRFSCTAQ
ncbi:putative histone acetyltransferase HAC-like 1 [Silene latifolia]|uniref:putative histone acetyltransferase HAC-like 1 n=1 Tax=Silene latifolia TaxID=37657 RepID=UPI003D76D9B4